MPGRAHRSAKIIGVGSSALIAMLAVVAGGRVGAQAVDIPAILDADLKAPPTIAIVQYGHQFGAEIEDGGGTELSRDTAFFGVAHRTKLAEHTMLFTLGNYTLHGYDFSGGEAANNRYRWDRVHRGVLAGIVGHDTSDRFRILGGAMIRTWGETGADFGDTLTGGLLAGFDYHPSENLSIGAIVGLLNKLEGGIGILPVPTLKWKFADDWRLNVGMVQLVDPGIGAQLDHQLTPELSLGGGFTFQSRQFRLSGANRVGAADPGRARSDDNGVGQETEIPVFAMLRYRPAPRVELDLTGGVALRGNVRVEDEHGGRLADDDYEPAGLLALKGQIAF